MPMRGYMYSVTIPVPLRAMLDSMNGVFSVGNIHLTVEVADAMGMS